MLNIKKIICGKGLVCYMAFTLCCNYLYAQNAQLTEARTLAADKKYKEAIEIYKEIYTSTPDSIYSEYLDVLKSADKYKVAEQVVAEQMGRQPQDQFLHIDLGMVYKKEKKEKKAKEEFEAVLKMISGDDILTQHIAGAFIAAGEDDYAIQAYRKATLLLNSPGLYAMPIARLYAKDGQLNEAISVMLESDQGQYINVDGAKALLLEIVGDDSVKLQQAQKALIKKINELPGNVYYAELLTWIYTQKNDWDGALIQIEAVDARNQENGRRLIDFARTANGAKQYDAAQKAYDDVIEKGPEQPFYTVAQGEKMSVALAQLKDNPNFTPEQARNIANEYDSLITHYPQFYSTLVAADYALVLAQYAGDVPGAIAVLQTAIATPATRKGDAALYKLQMGDYYLLENKIWDASLTYSQVDKEFKQDVLGEDARFRNAKLAYYRGDFEWAQRQLSILKASTTELIANDALYLSVLITENVEDSDYLPLQRFAYADLLLFQNKDKEAEALLDSINLAFPKHPLNDDIIMQRAKIAEKHHDYQKALAYLKTINEQYSQDVLGDDAVFKMAEIYQNDLHQPDQARHYYEQLIIDYPGSTYVQTARQRLADMGKTGAP